MAIKNNKLGGTDWINGDTLYAGSLNDTFDSTYDNFWDGDGVGNLRHDIFKISSNRYTSDTAYTDVFSYTPAASELTETDIIIIEGIITNNSTNDGTIKITIDAGGADQTLISGTMDSGMWIFKAFIVQGSSNQHVSGYLLVEGRTAPELQQAASLNNVDMGAGASGFMTNGSLTISLAGLDNNNGTMNVNAYMHVVHGGKTYTSNPSL